MAGLKKQVNVNTKRMKVLMKDIRNDVYSRTKNSKSIDEWLQKLHPYVGENCLVNGIHGEEVGKIIRNIANTTEMTKLPPGANQEIVKGVMSEACMTYVTNVGKDIQTELQKIAVEGYNNNVAPKELANTMAERIDVLSTKRAQTIARTETMRANNLSNLIAAKENGAKSYTISCDENACDLCLEVYGDDEDVVFDIDDTDNFPPLHPNCRCTPRFSTKPVEDEETTEDLEDDTELPTEPLETNTEINEYGKEMDVYKYPDMELAIEKGLNLNQTEIREHINQLPPELRGNADRITFHEHVNMKASGDYSSHTNSIRVYGNGITSKYGDGFSYDNTLGNFNIITHELAHAADYKNANKGATVREAAGPKLHSNPEIWGKLAEKDNEFNAKTLKNGKKKVRNVFPTDYAARNFLKEKKAFRRRQRVDKNLKGKPWQSNPRLYIEDFADSTAAYLNPTSHAAFCKKFPNRAKYLEKIYGKPKFSKDHPILKAMENEKVQQKLKQEKVKKENELQKKLENLSKKEMDEHLTAVLGKSRVNAYYAMKAQYEKSRKITNLLSAGWEDVDAFVASGFTKAEAQNILKDKNKALRESRQTRKKYGAILTQVENDIKKRL